MPTYPINMGDTNEPHPLYSIATAGEQAGAGNTQTTIDDNNKMLIEAAKSCIIDTVKKLLNENNVDINFQDKYGETALMIASENGYFGVVEKLLGNGANVNLATPANEYKPGIKHGETALMIASKNGHLGIVKQLILAGAEIDKANSSEKTALFKTCVSGYNEIAEILIIAGAKVNQTDGSGETPIFEACRHGHHETVRTLIKHGANLEVMNSVGESALMVACERGSNKCARILIQHDADTRGLSSFEKVTLGVRNLFSRSTKGNQLSPVATSAGEQEEQDPMGAATNAPISRKEQVNEKISSWLAGQSEGTFAQPTNAGTSPAASGNARNNPPVPLEVNSTLTSYADASTSPNASGKNAEAIAQKTSPTQTRQ